MNLNPATTVAEVEEEIDSEDYHQFPGTTQTVCCIQLHNGFSIIGQSSCVNRVDFDEELGKIYAREDAIRKLGPFFALRRLDNSYYIDGANGHEGEEPLPVIEG